MHSHHSLRSRMFNDQPPLVHYEHEVRGLSVEMQMFNWIIRFFFLTSIFWCWKLEVDVGVWVSKSVDYTQSIYHWFLYNNNIYVSSETDNIIIILMGVWRFSPPRAVAATATVIYCLICSFSPAYHCLCSLKHLCIVIG